MKVFISGPMSGYEGYNRTEFIRAENALRARGYDVYNPADLPDGLSDEEYMMLDFMRLIDADAICFLPGFRDSQGAMAEFYTALRLGKLQFRFVPRAGIAGDIIPVDLAPHVVLTDELDTMEREERIAGESPNIEPADCPEDNSDEDEGDKYFADEKVMTAQDFLEIISDGLTWDEQGKIRVDHFFESVLGFFTEDEE